MSIVNGAQTTGALGTLPRLPPESVKVQARFIKVKDADADLIQNIIQYNNSQNKVEASDFRSTDKIQKRLKMNLLLFLMLNMMEEDEEVLKVSFVEKLIYCLLILLVKL